MWIDALILLIEQVYTEKFATDATYFKATLKENRKEKVEMERPPFPQFVCEFLKGRIKSTKQLTQVG